VYKRTVEPKNFIFTLIKKEDGATLKYTWEERNKIIHFLDPQYALVSGELFPLEYIMEKAPQYPPIPVQP
jgi:hypothetical protein